MRELDLSRSKIRELEGLRAQDFCNLRELILDGNLLPTCHTVPRLPALTLLRLNHNQITSTPPPREAGDTLNGHGPRGLGQLSTLEVLQLGFNQITELPPLHLSGLQALRVLHLQGNEISRVDGLQHLHELRELVLDRNKIKALDAHSLAALANLRELRLEENGLRTLDHFAPLPKLQVLALGSNRILDVAELEKLGALPALQQIVLVNNPVARKQLYRPTLIRRLPSLKSIDGRELTLDERDRAELIFAADFRPAGPSSAFVQDQRYGTAKVPLKLTSMNFEMMSGLQMGGGPQIGGGAPLMGIGVGGGGGGHGSAPHSADSLRNGGHGGTAADWQPLSETREWRQQQAAHGDDYSLSSASRPRRASDGVDAGSGFQRASNARRGSNTGRSEYSRPHR